MPSDFFHTKLNWANSFPLNRTLSLDHTVSYQIMHKDVDCLTPVDAVFDPPDADYRYSAKVNLRRKDFCSENFIFGSFFRVGDADIASEFARIIQQKLRVARRW